MRDATNAFNCDADGAKRLFSRLWNETAINQALGNFCTIWAHSGISDQLLEAITVIANERRNVVLNNLNAWRPVPQKWGKPLPALIKKSVTERRALAVERHRQADKLIAELPPAVRGMFPTQSSIRAVAWAICFLSARDRGHCDASIATIGQIAGCSRSGVNQALVALRRSGIIKVISGKATGQVSTIMAILPALLKIIQKRRQQMKQNCSDKKEQSSFFYKGGVQKIEQKTQSSLLKDKNENFTEKETLEKGFRRKSFPASGSIYYSHWHNLVKKHSKGIVPDANLVANRFRNWCKSNSISLDVPKIEERFIKFIERHKI